MAPGERLLSLEADGGGLPVVATDRGLYHGGDDDGWLRLGWEQIRRIDWDGRRRTLLLRPLAANVPPSTVVLRHGSALVALARERVAWCTLPVGPTRLDGVGTLLAVRRQPGADRLVWLVAFDAEVESDDPVTSARLTSALHRVRARTGL